jgi:hypothetical protein
MDTGGHGVPSLSEHAIFAWHINTENGHSCLKHLPVEQALSFPFLHMEPGISQNR